MNIREALNAITFVGLFVGPWLYYLDQHLAFIAFGLGSSAYFGSRLVAPRESR